MKHLLIATNDFFRRCFEPIRFIKSSLLKTTTCNQFVADFPYFFTGPSCFSLAHGPLVHWAWEHRTSTKVVDARHGTQTAMAVGLGPQERSSYLMREVIRCHQNVWVGFGMSKLDCASHESFLKWFGGYAFCHRFSSNGYYFCGVVDPDPKKSHPF